jgi:hypothetical protein
MLEISIHQCFNWSANAGDLGYLGKIYELCKIKLVTKAYEKNLIGNETTIRKLLIRML